MQIDLKLQVRILSKKDKEITDNDARKLLEIIEGLQTNKNSSINVWANLFFEVSEKYSFHLEGYDLNSTDEE
jgi:hypothetical protein